MENWENTCVTVGTKGKINLEVTLGQLFIAGMEKQDLLSMLQASSDEDAAKIIALREIAGDIFTEMQISTRMATQLLINVGEKDYQKGIRKPYTIYAHKKLNQQTWYLKYIILAIIIFILYQIFK